jgi:tetratricopeptide (TPR) repeat protein
MKVLRALVSGLALRPGRRARGRLLTEALRLREAGAVAAAASMLEPALAERPGDVEALLLLADIRRELGASAEAQQIARRVIGEQPDCADAWAVLGAALRAAGELRQAADAYLRAISIAPENMALRIELAVALLELNQSNDAISLLQFVLNREPDSMEAHGNIGIALQRRHRPVEALPHFARAAAGDPRNVLLQNNYALALREAERLDEAEQVLQAAYAREPAHPTTRSNLAMVLVDLGRTAEARALLEPLIASAPEFIEARCTLARALQDLGDADAALSHIEHALAQAPDNANTRMMRAFEMLCRADFARGWDDYAARLLTQEAPYGGFPFPEWQGEPLSGKAVLVYAEQGIGDEIMFASCFGDLMNEAARTVIECDPRLHALFVRSFPGAAVLPRRLKGEHPSVAEAGSIDVQLPAGSLPRRYRPNWQSFPRHHGYLQPDPAKVAAYKARLAALPGSCRIGLSWRGGLARTRRALRSVEPRTLAPLIERDGIQIVCLQHAASGADLEALRAIGGDRVHRWPEALTDADETAALMAALDCTVTVCNYLVHLGGALGLDVRVMVPASPEWRYLRQGSEMPWYPSVRLTRQRFGDEWGAVVREIAASL